MTTATRRTALMGTVAFAITVGVPVAPIFIDRDTVLAQSIVNDIYTRGSGPETGGLHDLLA